MSPAFPLDDDVHRDIDDRSSFWISPVDEKGNVAREEFVSAAYAKAKDLMRYRSRELRDEALRLNLIDRAVHKASRVSKPEAIRDFAGYLFSVFARLVDAQVAKDRTIVLMSTECLEGFAARNASRENPYDDKLQQGEVLDAMDETTRWAWHRRISGFEVQEIAADLNVSADCLSTRLRRGLQTAQRLLGYKPNARQ
jgi:DNA-directed RNA polymerase specialized sigma24 family protein